MAPKYLFILSPPYSGSTALWRLLQSSAQVSALPDEGQKLPELAPVMRQNPWDSNQTFDWEQISRVWHSYWDASKTVLLEKSPPHLCRSAELVKHFEPAYFILLLRDPYATCETLHRRNALSYTKAAERWVNWLEMHLACRAALQNLTLVYYESLADKPDETVAQLARWMPELADVDPDTKVTAHSVHGVQERTLTNLNADKLDRLSERDRAAVSSVLEHHRGLIEQTPYAAALD